ncbi:MAG: NAD-dependent DNA ligase LigA [Bacteroidales bacterium]|nr:NAD-dependent DNA ligase LigA [Bacteroidales bacterium]
MYTLEDFNRRDTNNQASLTAALSWASMKYYVENDPPMSDFEFDMEFKQLQRLEAESGQVLEGSPTQRVGSDIQGGFQKHSHIIPMQSIENVYSDEELQQWLSATTRQLQAAFPGEEVSYTYEPKYDGLSISLIYTDGVLTDAVTRGNQIEGESVIENVRTIINVPQRLQAPAAPVEDLFAAPSLTLPHILDVRGEVLMPQGAFDRLNAEKAAQGEKPFANKRNAASGSLKQLDPKVTAKRGLIVNAYGAYSTDADWQRENMPSQEATLTLLDQLGFSHYTESRAFADVRQLTDAINRFNEVRIGHLLPYDCDGVVVKVNQRRHQEFLGLNATFPNWCKARKFPQEAQSTLVRGVTFQVGMTGHITPVAELDPTAISGSIVSRATLNNESYIRQLNLTIGSYVFVQKAGEVIPQVTGLDETRNQAEAVSTTPIVFPTACPCCGTELQKKGEYWICPNHHCKEQAIQRLEYWCGKDCANIKGLGPNVLADLYDKLDVASVNDLYRVFVVEADAYEPDIFHADYADVLQEKLGEGYAEKSIRLMLDGIRQSIPTLTLDRILGGLGIDGVGKITGKLLAQHFGTLEAFRQATLEELTLIEGIGEVMARNILEADLSDYSCLWRGDERANALGAPLPFCTSYQAAQKLGDALAGLTIIFTGTSYRFKRDEIKEFFIGHGAKYVGSVSGKVNYVVTGDAPGQNKLDKARQLGVEVIAERDFYEKFGL